MYLISYYTVFVYNVNSVHSTLSIFILYRPIYTFLLFFLGLLDYYIY